MYNIYTVYIVHTLYIKNTVYHAVMSNDVTGLTFLMLNWSNDGGRSSSHTGDSPDWSRPRRARG